MSVPSGPLINMEATRVQFTGLHGCTVSGLDKCHDGSPFVGHIANASQNRHVGLCLHRFSVLTVIT